MISTRAILQFSAVLALIVTSPALAQSLPGGLILHLDASDVNGDGGATSPNDGAPVTTWMDLSGNGNHVTAVDTGVWYSNVQNHGGNPLSDLGVDPRPTFKSSVTALGGRPALYWDGFQADNMQTAGNLNGGFSLLDPNQQVTAVYVFQSEEAPVPSVQFGGRNARFLNIGDMDTCIISECGFDGLILPGRTDGDGVNVFVLGNNGEGTETSFDPTADLQSHILISSYDGVDPGDPFALGGKLFSQYINDSTPNVSGTWGQNEFVGFANSILTLGNLANPGTSQSVPDGPGNHDQGLFKTNLAEVMVFNRTLTSQEVEDVGLILQNKYEVPGDFGPTGEAYFWSTPGFEFWSNASNWRPGDGAPPDGDVDVEFGGSHFGQSLAAPSTVVVDAAARTARTVTFDSATKYVVGGSKSLTINAGSNSNGAINVNQGDHEFQLPVSTTSNTTVDVAGGASLAFNREVSLGGNTLTKIGDGTLAFNNNVATPNGNVDCQAGSCSGTGTIGGNLNNSSGTVAPGNSPGILTVDGDYTQGQNATLAIELGGLILGEEHDKLIVTGAANLDGTLDVTLLPGFTPNNGDMFDVLDFASFTGDFSTLPTSFAWDVNTGVLTFTDGGGFTDFDNSGSWDLPDLNLVLFNWQQDEASLPGEWVKQRPATVGLESLNLVLFNWQQASSLAVVPEPATALGASLGLLALFVCSSRRRPR